MSPTAARRLLPPRAAGLTFRPVAETVRIPSTGPARAPPSTPLARRPPAAPEAEVLT